MKRKELLPALFGIALLGLVAFFWLSPAGLGKAPQATITTLDGQTITLQGLQGRPVLVTFWATTCSGCVKEIPHLVELYRELGPRGLMVVGVAMSYDEPAQITAMVAAKEINYPIAHDNNGSLASAFGGVNVTPTSFLINPNGTIVLKHLGEMEMGPLSSQIQGMLNQASSGEAG